MTISLTVEPRGHDVTAVLFAGLSPRRKIYEWWGTFQDMPANVVALHDGYFKWWQTETEETAQRIREALKEAGGKRTIALGASAGGFGAFLFGALCQMDSVLAFVPQTVIGPRKRAFDNRWPKYCETIRKDGPYTDIADLKPPPSTIVYAGDDPLDTLHARRITDAKYRMFLTGGHTLPEELRNNGILHDMIDTAIARCG